MIERRSFLFALAASGLPGTSLGGAPAAAWALERALVLSGGGARGAYEGGVVGALAAAAGVADRSPLPPYEVVCGTSIGALNGWFVATGRYTELRKLWYGISGEKLIALKRQYAALTDPQSGLLNRAASAVSLVWLTRNQNGLLKSEPVFEWIARNIDPDVPLLIPLIWAVTNLSQQRPEYFFLRPKTASADLSARIERALKLSLGPQTIVREATPDLLHRAIFASAAVPIVFDPVLMPGPDGAANAYCDGGVASNSPVGIAHAVASAADVVLLSPPFEPQAGYGDAVEVAYAAFGTAQRKILEVEMRDAYFQSLGRRAFDRLSPRDLAGAARGNAALATFMRSVPETELRYLRPLKALPLSLMAFDDEAAIGRAYQIGWEDAAHGFIPYDWTTFAL